jgi:uncharacterized membrane protein (UPF0127 family)
MLGAIDVLFLDRDHRVLAVSPSLKPWRIRAGPTATAAVLELPAGYTLEHGIGPGDLIECQLG